MIENGERVFSEADVGTDDILVSLPGALVPRGTIVGLQPIKSSINGDLLKEALQKLLNRWWRVYPLIPLIFFGQNNSPLGVGWGGGVYPQFR